MLVNLDNDACIYNIGFTITVTWTLQWTNLVFFHRFHLYQFNVYVKIYHILNSLLWIHFSRLANFLFKLSKSIMREIKLQTQFKCSDQNCSICGGSVRLKLMVILCGKTKSNDNKLNTCMLNILSLSTSTSR